MIDVKGNEIEFDFHKIPATTKLRYLRLSGTGLKVLDGLSRATELTDLHVTNNEIRRIPQEVFSMVQLQSLFLSYNSITGTISTNIGRLTNLKDLYMFGNHITGTIPSHMGQLSLLEDFVAAKNFLSGTIPSQFSTLPKLEQLSIYDQDGLELITGPVPDFAGAPNLW